MIFNKNKDKIKKRIAKANNLFDSFKRDESIQEFLKLQQEFPENTDIMFSLAVVRNSMQKQILAIDIFKNILKINSNHKNTLLVLPTVIYEYAVRLSEEGKKELARQYFLDFVSFGNGNKIDLANGFKELALIEELFGNTTEAKSYINAALNIVSDLETSEYTRSYKSEYEEINDRINGC